MKYKCKDCGHIFEEWQVREWIDPFTGEENEYADWPCCPKCSSDNTEDYREPKKIKKATDTAKKKEPAVKDDYVPVSNNKIGDPLYNVGVFFGKMAMISIIVVIVLLAYEILYK